MAVHIMDGVLDVDLGLVTIDECDVPPTSEFIHRSPKQQTRRMERTSR